MVIKAKGPEKLRITLHIVFYQDAGFWIAHCLEMDVMGHHREKTAALRSLIEAVAIQITESIKANNHANIFMPADARFFEMYAAGKDVAQAECVVDEVKLFVKLKDDVTIEGIEARTYQPALAMA